MAFSVIGLTGGTGAGKGVAASYLTALGIPCLDTDRVSREVCMPGKPCLAALVRTFGEEILNEDGSLARKTLAALVFGEPDEEKKAEKLASLNHITHAYILDACREWLAERREEGCRAACIDAPQLFESGFACECDHILGVTADSGTRIMRIMARDGIDRAAAEARLAAQHDDDFFYSHCDAVLVNDGTPEELLPKVQEVLSAWGLL